MRFSPDLPDGVAPLDVDADKEDFFEEDTEDQKQSDQSADSDSLVFKFERDTEESPSEHQDYKTRDPPVISDDRPASPCCISDHDSAAISTEEAKKTESIVKRVTTELNAPPSKEEPNVKDIDTHILPLKLGHTQPSQQSRNPEPEQRETPRRAKSSRISQLCANFE